MLVETKCVTQGPQTSSRHVSIDQGLLKVCVCGKAVANLSEPKLTADNRWAGNAARGEAPRDAGMLCLDDALDNGDTPQGSNLFLQGMLHGAPIDEGHDLRSQRPGSTKELVGDSVMQDGCLLYGATGIVLHTLASNTARKLRVPVAESQQAPRFFAQNPNLTCKHNFRCDRPNSNSRMTRHFMLTRTMICVHNTLST